MDMLLCDKVSFTYAGGGRALTDINLRCAEGGYTLVTGPSGAGKSTLFRLLVRLEEPAAGTIFFRDVPVSEYPPTLLRRRIMLMPQIPALFPGTVRETLLLPWTFVQHKECGRPDDARLAEWLECLQLSEIDLDENAAELSVGQRQRLCLIRCLLLEPEVLLLDEPTSALDAESRRLVLETVRDRHLEHGMTVLQIDHSGYAPAFPHTRYVMKAGTLERTNG